MQPTSPVTALSPSRPHPGALLRPGRVPRNGVPAQGSPKLFLIPQMDWQVNQTLWAFRFLFLTGKLSFWPIRLDMLVWGVWSFACTIKIHCACWDLRPRPREAPIPPRGHGSSQAAGGSQAGTREQGPGTAQRALLVQDRCRFSLGGSGCWSDGGQLCHSSALCVAAGELWCEHTWVPRHFPASGHHHFPCRATWFCFSPLGFSLFHCYLLFQRKSLRPSRDKEVRLCSRPGPEERKVWGTVWGRPTWLWRVSGGTRCLVGPLPRVLGRR